MHIFYCKAQLYVALYIYNARETCCHLKILNIIYKSVCFENWNVGLHSTNIYISFLCSCQDPFPPCLYFSRFQSISFPFPFLLTFKSIWTADFDSCSTWPSQIIFQNPVQVSTARYQFNVSPCSWEWSFPRRFCPLLPWTTVLYRWSSPVPMPLCRNCWGWSLRKLQKVEPFSWILTLFLLRSLWWNSWKPSRGYVPILDNHAVCRERWTY